MTKILLFGSEPEKMTRLRYIYESLAKHGIKAEILMPKSNFRCSGKLGRILSGLIRYLTLTVQLLIAKADIIHYFNIPDIPGIIILLKKLFTRTVVIYDVRSPWGLELENTFHFKLLKYLAETMERLMTVRSDLVLAVNTPLAVRALRWGAKRVFVLPNYPRKTFKPSKNHKNTKRLFVRTIVYSFTFRGKSEPLG